MIVALPAVTVSAIFLAWSACRRERQRRERLLRERVAYMLWAAAHADEPRRRRPPKPRGDSRKRR
jgi:hypothetical protein